MKLRTYLMLFQEKILIKLKLLMQIMDSLTKIKKLSLTILSKNTDNTRLMIKSMIQKKVFLDRKLSMMTLLKENLAPIQRTIKRVNPQINLSIHQSLVFKGHNNLPRLHQGSNNSNRSLKNLFLALLITKSLLKSIGR